MTKNFKKKHYSRENASNMDTKEIKQIKKIKLKYLSGKENEYGTNHFFQLLDITPLQELVELRDSMKMPIWENNNKFYLKVNAVKAQEAKVENGFNKDHPYIMDLTFSKYDLQKNGKQITGYSISEINKMYYILIYRNGIVRTKFNYYY